MSTAAEDREAVVDYLRRRGGWTPIRILAAWMAAEVGLSPIQGQADLRILIREGRIERRATWPCAPRPAYEYRAVEVAT